MLLGGHSLGASLAAAYAAWDFDGKPGCKDLDGIVMIDGGLLGSFDAYTLAEAQEQVGTLGEEPFLDLLGIGIPEAAGLFAEIGGIFAKLDPDRRRRGHPGLPAAAGRVQAAGAGDEPGPASATPSTATPRRSRSALLHVNAGGLAESGEPRDWVDGGVTPVANLAETFGQEPANAVEWYFPRRLTIDTNGANDDAPERRRQVPRTAARSTRRRSTSRSTRSRPT